MCAVESSQQEQGGGSQAAPLKNMFNAVPRRYDLLNRLLTFWLDEPWRAIAVRQCLAESPQRVLDLCCGTGDLTRQLAAKCSDATELFGFDFSPAMLEQARIKAKRTGYISRVELVEGNAAAMEFADGHFDSVGIAFGFRNLTWRNRLKDAALSEVHRVLRSGGRFVIVETSQPQNAAWRWLYHAFLKVIAGPVGTWISGHPSAYRYLAESASDYYTADEVKEMLLSAGFSKVSYQRLLGGVAAVHTAVK